MQSIITKYRSGSRSISAKCWNGQTTLAYDLALNSEDNHKAAAEKLVSILNKGRNVSWGIVSSAPLLDNGQWIFIINYVPDVPPMHMSITVKFLPCTNTKPARMKVFSWLYEKGFEVAYSPNIADASDIYQCALYAANKMLEEVNGVAFEHNCEYRIKDYVHTFDGNRVFTLELI